MTPPNAALRMMAEALVAMANADDAATRTVTITETLTLATTAWSLSRLYDVKPETRLTAADVAAILKVDRGALYKRLKRDRVPHRKRKDRTLIFIAGDLLRHLEDAERVVVPVPDRGAGPRRIK